MKEKNNGYEVGGVYELIPWSKCIVLEVMDSDPNMHRLKVYSFTWGGPLVISWQKAQTELA